MDNMDNQPKKVEECHIVLRQITDHIFQCLQRIEDDIEHIVFIRKNSNMQNISKRFYVQQIDRFSRDALITFYHILDKDRNGSTLHSLILQIKDKQRRKKMELRLDKLRRKSEIIISHRNNVIAHHQTKYSSQLGNWYPTQPFGYFYILNPCLCNSILNETAKLFWDLKSTLKIDGIGGFSSGGGKIKDVFKTKALGEIKIENEGLFFSHKCRYKKCLLK